MSYIFFTSDMHFGHISILEYCNRPFDSIDDMNDGLISNWNRIIRKDDVIYHLGDWAFTGRAGSKQKAQYWETLLNGKIIFIKGNHDSSNGLKGEIDSATLSLNKKRVFICHRPPIDRSKIPADIDFILCGHIHQFWKHLWLRGETSDKDIPIINVGIDVWNYKPVRLDCILNYYNQCLRLPVEKRIYEYTIEEQ